jgi:hypothetical protein
MHQPAATTVLCALHTHTHTHTHKPQVVGALPCRTAHLWQRSMMASRSSAGSASGGPHCCWWSPCCCGAVLYATHAGTWPGRQEGRHGRVVRMRCLHSMRDGSDSDDMQRQHAQACRHSTACSPHAPSLLYGHRSSPRRKRGALGLPAVEEEPSEPCRDAPARTGRMRAPGRPPTRGARRPLHKERCCCSMRAERSMAAVMRRAAQAAAGDRPVLRVMGRAGLICLLFGTLNYICGNQGGDARGSQARRGAAVGPAGAAAAAWPSRP